MDEGRRGTAGGNVVEDCQIIELRPNVTTFAIAYGGFLIAVAVLLLPARSQSNALSSGTWSSGAALLLAASCLLVLMGASYIVVATTRPKTLTLDQQGIRLRKHGKESLLTWPNIDQVIYTRMSFGKNTNSAVVVESQGRTALSFGPGYRISPQELFELIENYVKIHSIPVPVWGAVRPGDPIRATRSGSLNMF